MAIQIQLRQGTTTEHNTFKGAVGEVTVDTTKKTVVVHDGVTLGGTVLAKVSEVPSLIPQATETALGVAKIATTAIAQAGTNDTDFLTAKKLRDALNAVGDAPIYAFRAWGIIGGTHTPASLIKGGNVASIIDKGVGRYQVVFTTPLESVDYAVLFGNIIYTDGNIYPYGATQQSTKTTTGFEIACGGSSYVDVTELYFGVIA